MLHATVGSEHLLIGILRVEGCLAMRILAQHGLDVYTVREEVLSHRQGARGLAAEEGAAVPLRVRPRPDRARRRRAASTR